ncbi:MAG TPA: integrase arm-type DNA-binding domain-containing protein [Thiobacillus sp.]|nr:integrase arm-type DNA-binding domain-containing protein [Thiobacillus sp.]
MMGKKAKELSALEVNRLSKAGMYFVGGVAGLALQVSGAGARSWILRKMIAGKRRDMGLGGFPDVTLAGAREKARQVRELVDQGIDPIEDRRAKRATLAAERAKAMTFSQCVTAYLDAHGDSWKNAKHRQQWANTLDTYANPIIGNLNVSAVDTGLVLKVLEPIWKTKTETASRLRGRIENILSWATVRGYRQGENPARWKGHLDKLLAARSKIQQVTHHAALPYAELGSFMADLAKMDGMGARALEFAILCASRSGEVRGATWNEIDLNAGVWIIPAERMKAKREHRVPLSSKAVSLLNTLPRLDGTELVFPGTSGQLSNMSLTAVLRRMNRGDLTAHGFRSTFRDWAAEQTAYPSEVVEMALAHTIANKVEAAYRRGDLFDKRRRLMDDWAKYCGTARRVVGEVIALKKQKVA